MKLNTQNWSDISSDPISEEAIRALHLPQENFKLYVNTHESGTRFSSKAGHAFVLYVLAGECKITVDESEVDLHAAEFIALEKGSYEFEVLGKEQLKIMKVFSLS